MITLKCFWKLAYVLNLQWNMCIYDPKEDIFVSGGIAKRGNWEGPMVSLMLRTMQKHPGCRLLDIGGNIGYYTLAAAASGYAVDVFEPVPANAAMIQQSLFANNFTNVKLHTCAISSKIGELGMGLAKNNQGGVHHVAGQSSTTMLPSLTLDHVLTPSTDPVYIKIDIEGGECLAIEGMQKYLHGTTKIVGVNMEFGQSKNCCKNWIQSGGFFDILTHKHNLCPKGVTYSNICNSNQWDLVWLPCSDEARSKAKHAFRRTDG